MGITKKHKQTELGLFPDDWEIKPIGNHIDLLTGFPFPSNEYTRTGVRLLRGSNIKRGETDWSDDITEFWPRITSDLRKYQLEDGDIVIPMDGSLVGKSYSQITEKDLPCLLLQRVARIRSNSIEINFLKHFVASKYFVSHCDSVKTVTAIPHISPTDIRGFTIPFPPTKNEQSCIAKVLTEIDDLIHDSEKYIAKKRNTAFGTMQKLLYPKKDWEVKKLGEVVLVNMGQSPLSGNYNTKGIGLPLIQGNADIDKRKQVIRNWTSQITKTCNKGDLIMTVRAPVGTVGVAIEKSCIGRGVCSFKPIGIQKNFFFHLMIYKEKDWKMLEQGSTFTSANSSQIVKFEIAVPKSPDEQIMIADILSDMNAEIEVLEMWLKKYKQIKQGMMQQLLTGKIRLV
jgi:type I restriction enzyme, S subunit